MVLMMCITFCLLLCGLFDVTRGATYGVMRSDLQCYNCTWTRNLNSTIWERIPTASDLCSLDKCGAAVDGVCVKDVAKKDGVVMAVRRFCATSNEAQGCFERDEVGGMKRTMCLCSDWHYCNSAKSLRQHWPIIFLFGAILWSGFVFVTS